MLVKLRKAIQRGGHNGNRHQHDMWGAWAVRRVLAPRVYPEAIRWLQRHPGGGGKPQGTPAGAFPTATTTVEKPSFARNRPAIKGVVQLFYIPLLRGSLLQ